MYVCMYVCRMYVTPRVRRMNPEERCERYLDAMRESVHLGSLHHVRRPCQLCDPQISKKCLFGHHLSGNCFAGYLTVHAGLPRRQNCLTDSCCVAARPRTSHHPSRLVLKHGHVFCLADASHIVDRLHQVHVPSAVTVLLHGNASSDFVREAG